MISEFIKAPVDSSCWFGADWPPNRKTVQQLLKNVKLRLAGMEDSDAECPPHRDCQKALQAMIEALNVYHLKGSKST
eukprot:3025877-Pyramimonas_sp.AAC.1